MKHAKYILLLALCLALTACGPKEAPVGSAAQSGGGSSSQSADVSQSEPDVSAPGASAPDVSEPEPLPPLTGEDKAAAYDAACDYYLGTPFEVHTLTEIDMPAGWEGEIAFQVSCSKGGVKVDPDRTISLERQDGVWTVVNEGY